MEPRHLFSITEYNFSRETLKLLMYAEDKERKKNDSDKDKGEKRMLEARGLERSSPYYRDVLSTLFSRSLCISLRFASLVKACAKRVRPLTRTTKKTHLYIMQRKEGLASTAWMRSSLRVRLRFYTCIRVFAYKLHIDWTYTHVCTGPGTHAWDARSWVLVPRV